MVGLARELAQAAEERQLDFALSFVTEMLHDLERMVQTT
jgi:hypothetical protein